MSFSFFLENQLRSFFRPFLAFVFALPIQAAPEGKWLEARQAYDKGEYPLAVSLYSELTQQDDASGYVYYNLGNSQYRSQHRGEAMAAYLAARARMPRNPDIKANLKYVHGQGLDHVNIERNPSIFFFWQSVVTSSELYAGALGVGAFSLLLLAMGWWLLTLSWLRTFGRVGIFCALLVGAAAWRQEIRQDVWGAVVKTEAKVYSAPGAHNLVLFSLHEGAPFLRVQQTGEWTQILLLEDTTEKIGWVATSDIRVYP